MTHIKHKPPKANEGVECAAWIRISPSHVITVHKEVLSALPLAMGASVKAASEEGFLPDFLQVYRLQLEQTNQKGN